MISKLKNNDSISDELPKKNIQCCDTQDVWSKEITQNKYQFKTTEQVWFMNLRLTLQLHLNTTQRTRMNLIITSKTPLYILTLVEIFSHSTKIPKTLVLDILKFPILYMLKLFSSLLTLVIAVPISRYMQELTNQIWEF